MYRENVGQEAACVCMLQECVGLQQLGEGCPVMPQSVLKNHLLSCQLSHSPSSSLMA